MQVHRINNQQAFGMKFILSNKILGEFSTNVENYIKAQNLVDKPGIKIATHVRTKSKEFIDNLSKSIIEHNNNDRNHTVFSDNINIKGIDITKSNRFFDYGTFEISTEDNKILKIHPSDIRAKKFKDLAEHLQNLLTDFFGFPPGSKYVQQFRE